VFKNLSDRFQQVFTNLRGRGKLTESEVRAALREIRIVLLEADVNLEVVREFVHNIQAKAVGSEVLTSLRPEERVMSIVHGELIATLGGKTQSPILNNQDNVWVLMGLQGSGKTTTAAKLAYRYKSQGRRPLLVAADTQRPAAREQLRTLAGQASVPILEVNKDESPEHTRARLNETLRLDYRDLVIVDTAGRTQVDREMLDSLSTLCEALEPSEKFLVLDAMTGQQSLSVANTFDDVINITGLIMTKLDGDARGGAALSATRVTGKPIVFSTTSEKIDGLEPFHPDRIAGRILGMGDVLTLIEKAKEVEAGDHKHPNRLKDFSLQEMLDQMKLMKQMGSFSDLLKMIPGAGKLVPAEAEFDEREVLRVEAIITSMTDEERRKPRLLNANRRKRIANGSGTTIQEVNRFMKNYEQTKKFIKQMGRRGKTPGFSNFS
jgi:signal recognition particle subunit SRP54